MTVLDAVSVRGGVARTAELLSAGASKREIAASVASGALVRPRQGWVALRTAVPHLIAAARAGVVLTCVTEASRRGLWVRQESSGTDGDSRAHVGAPAHSGAVSALNAVVHWSRPWMTRVPGSLVDPIENVLQMVAFCQTFESALAVWESALRKGLVALEGLRRMPLTGHARRLAEIATPFSDSGLETFVLDRLRWLRLLIVPQAWISGHRVDFLIGDRLVLQIDGGTHVGRQRDADNAHDAVLMALGYHVIRVGYRQVVERWHVVQSMIMRAIAQGLHLA